MLDTFNAERSFFSVLEVKAHTFRLKDASMALGVPAFMIKNFVPAVQRERMKNKLEE